MSGPAWKEDFPISWVDDDFVTRREFTKSLVWVSCASFAANLALMGRAAVKPRGTFPEMKVAERDELPIGGASVFHYPDADSPCLLVRLESDRFVAFSQKCTHLGCPVLFDQARRQLHCPCHEGFFDAETGHVLSGPPPRPLPVVALELRGTEVWALGVQL
jgi:Rieske Fe-S protein